MAEEKILKDEILDDEEIKQVSGGSRSQTSWDSYFLKRIGYMDETYDTLIATWGSGSAAIKAGWEKVGIKANTYRSDYNEYFDKNNNNKKITRKEAYTLALQRKGFNDIAIHDFDFDKYGDFG